MKKIMMAMVLALMAASVQAAPYVYVPFTKTVTYPNGAPLPASTGLLYNSDFSQMTSFTNFAMLYHPAFAGSFVDRLFPSIAPFIPSESWSLNLGGGGNSGNWIGGPGFSINFLDTVRQELSVGLSGIDNATAKSIAAVISPSSTGNAILTFGPQWTAPIVNGGVLAPLNQLRVTNHWYAGVGYTF